MSARSLLLSLVVALGLTTPILADVAIEEVLVRRRDRDMNIRVNLYNPSAQSQRGPVKITLYVRPDSSAPWEKIKVWKDVRSIKGGNRIARDFFEAGNTHLQGIAGSPAFEARAVVEAPGVRTQEATGVYNGEAP